MRRFRPLLGLAAAVALVGCIRDWDEFAFEQTSSGGGAAGSSGGSGGLGGTPTGGTVADCGNAELDGNESDVDCGGDCPPCQVGRTCYVDADCRSDRCESGTCLAATCDDNRRNADETDVDCGGPTCPPCTEGQTCQIDRDCTDADHAGGVCSDGLCTIECESGWENCSATSPDCETHIADDLANCGVCGWSCSSAHGEASCAAGECSMTRCDGGWDDCSPNENESRDGCETDLNATAEHCGECNDPCPADNTCREGVCCQPIWPGLSIQVATGTCFHVVPERCDCPLRMQVNGIAGSVSARFYWDIGGQIDFSWPSAGAEISFTPQSAFTAVIVATSAAGNRSFTWWSEGCSGSASPCFDVTE